MFALSWYCELRAYWKKMINAFQMFFRCFYPVFSPFIIFYKLLLQISSYQVMVCVVWSCPITRERLQSYFTGTNFISNLHITGSLSLLVICQHVKRWYRFGRYSNISEGRSTFLQFAIGSFFIYKHETYGMFQTFCECADTYLCVKI